MNEPISIQLEKSTNICNTLLYYRLSIITTTLYIGNLKNIKYIHMKYNGIIDMQNDVFLFIYSLLFITVRVILSYQKLFIGGGINFHETIDM